MKDMDKIVLQEGETLLLRPRTPITQEQADTVHAALKQANIRAVLIPADFDIFTGVLTSVPEPESNDRGYVEEAYNHGYVIQWRLWGDEDWQHAHQFASPLPTPFDWERYSYRLIPKS